MAHQQLTLGVLGSGSASQQDVRARCAQLVGRLETARATRNISHRRLGALAGLAPSTVRGALAADANPQLDTLVAIAGALGIELGLGAHAVAGGRCLNSG